MTNGRDNQKFAGQVRIAWHLNEHQRAQGENLIASDDVGFLNEAQRAQFNHGLYWAVVDTRESVVGIFFYPLDLPVCTHSPIDFTYVLPPALHPDWNYRNVEAISILLAAVTAETNGWIDRTRKLYFEPGRAGHLDSLRMTGMHISHYSNPRTNSRLWTLPYEAVPGLAAKTYAFMTYGSISGGLAGNTWIELADEVAYSDVVRQIAGGQRFPSHSEGNLLHEDFKLKIAEALANLRPVSQWPNSATASAKIPEDTNIPATIVK